MTVPRKIRVAGHETRVRDRRLRFGDPDVYAAECSCGWLGPSRDGRYGDRDAGRDGFEHLELEAARKR
jgi:hypothetical protein